MEKKIKRKCILCGICIIIGILILIGSLQLEGLSEMQRSYMSGFGNSFTVISIVLFIRNIRAIQNPKKRKEREIELTDERNIEISTKSMAITFRISILMQATASIVFVFMNYELGLYLGFLIGIQLIIFIISNVIVSKKI